MYTPIERRNACRKLELASPVHHPVARFAAAPVWTAVASQRSNARRLGLRRQGRLR